uniref:Major facilitator superfamily (MFS) profile domain-containing protein n=1 Tax=Oryza rufipogon TaxID=4529 RepID=A0A0E0N5N2_ORYRU
MESGRLLAHSDEPSSAASKHGDGRGGWRAALFIIAVGFLERVGFYGVQGNLMMYLTGLMGMSMAAAAAAANAWGGTVMVLTLVGALAADSHLGRYRAVVAAGVLYLLSLGMLTVSSTLQPKHPRPASCNGGATACLPPPSPTSRLAFFYAALYLLALAQGFHKPCSEAIGADQFADDADPGANASRSSYFNWFHFSTSWGYAVATTLLSYVEDNVSWTVGFAVCWATMVLYLAVFLLGTGTYRATAERPIDGAPLARLAETSAAAARAWTKRVFCRKDAICTERSGVSAYGRSGCAKRAGGGASFFSLPVSTLSLLELLPFFVGSFGWVEAAAGQWRKLKRPKRCCLVPGSPLAEHGERPAGGGTEVAWASSQGRSGGMQRAGGRVLRQVRKSAGGGAPVRSWWKPRAANACVVVNELMGDKLLERLQGFQAIVFAIIASQDITLFTKQGSTMNRNVGGGLVVPPAALQFAISVTIVTLLPVYDRALVPLARRLTRHLAGITTLQRVGAGMAMSGLAMAVAALVEAKRLRAASDAGLVDRPDATVPTSVWWLVPQFVLLGTSKVFGLIGLEEFFYDQVPVELCSVGLAVSLSVLGVGSYASGVLVSAIDWVTRGGGESWFSDNLNRAHLDYFYWILATLAALEVAIFVYIAKRYVYKNKGEQ